FGEMVPYNEISQSAVHFLLFARLTCLRCCIRDTAGRPMAEQQAIIEDLIQTLASTKVLFSTFGYVSSLKSLAMALNQHGISLPSVTYNSVGKDIILVEGVPVSLAIFQKVVQALAMECQNLIMAILKDYYPYERLPANLCNGIIDRLTESKPDFSFLSSAENPQLLVQLMAAGDGFMAWSQLKPDSPNGKSASWMRKWLTSTGNLCIQLMTLIQFTAGLPARVSEMEGLTFRNIGSSTRCLHWHANTLALVSFYNKSSSSNEIPKITVRYLPRFVSEMLVVYLLCIRSCEKLVAHCLCAQSPAAEPLVFCQAYYDLLFVKSGQAISTNQVSHSIKRAFTRVQPDAALGTQKYRQFAAALGESKTSFGREFQGQDRASLDRASDADQGNSMVDEQMGDHHQQSESLTFNRQRLEVVKALMPKLQPQREETQLRCQQAFETLQYNLSSSFVAPLQLRPAQVQVLSSILDNPTLHHLAVIPTGGGKSMFFVLAAKLLRRMVLVVVPFVALIRDHYQGYSSRVRPAMGTLGKKVPTQLQKILLSATVPQSMEDDLALAFQVPLSVHRFPSNRTNIRHMVTSAQSPGSAMVNLCSDLHHKMTREFSGTCARIIIYCAFPDDCTMVKNYLQEVH
ncbi:hypothetical protein LPJ53_005973, partial [Coemansia erecta]